MEKENKYNPESEVEQIIAKREQEWYRPWETEKEMRRLFTEAGKPLIEELGRAPLPTEFGNWTHIAFGDFTTGRIHDLLVYGNIAEGSLGDGESILARVHDTCKSGDTLSASNCDCGKELHETMRMIQEEERGVILYLDQEGRGAGPAGKMEQVNGMCEWKNGD
ncbi:hypothetical protein MUP56_02385, partial [Patescibacteria group bacterium]|nr:hypothetical protein [Patescibacteria group bacterium]